MTAAMTAGRWQLLIAGYFGLWLLLRMAMGPALYWDESEAFYNGQRLAWGYGPQPPLPFWLHWAAFRTLGHTLFAMSLLKAVVFGGAFVLLFRLLAREAGPDAAGTAVLCLSLVPVLSWEAQKAYTHTILAFFFAVAATGAALRALRRGGWGDHAWLGVVLGLGTLAKFNFLFWPLALLLAAAVLPDWRRGLRPLRLLLSAGIGAAIVLPVGLWMLGNARAATASVHKLGLEGAGPIEARLLGTGSVALATLAYAGLAALVLGGFAWRARRRAPERWAGRDPRPVLRLLAAALLAVLLMVWLGVLAAGATSIRERWLIPVGWALVPVLVLLLWPRLSARARRGLAATGGALWLVGLLALPVVSLVEPGHKGARYDLLAEVLEGEGAPGVPVYVSGSNHVGNLALAAPALDPTFYDGRAPDGAFLLVAEERFEAERRADEGLDARVAARRVVEVPRRGDPLRFVVLTVAAS